MKAYISYNEESETISGMFELIEHNNNFVKIKSSKNIIIIPYHRINKIKFQELKGGSNKK